MSRINRKAWARISHGRGMTLPELLIAMVILGLFVALAVTLLGPIMSAPNETQVKVSTVQSGVQALYRLQRDLRMTDASGVYACTGGLVTTCAAPTGTLAATDRFAIATPLDAADQLQTDAATNAVAWTGLRVYCVLPNNSGGSDLGYSYQAMAGIGPGRDGIKALSLSAVASAVAKACTGGDVTIVATNIQTLLVSADAGSSTVDVKLVARTNAGGKTNETSYSGEAYARN